MSANDDPETGIRFRRKWFRLGVAIALLHATFTLFVVGLLRVDRTLAIVVAAVVGIVGAAALVVFVLYRY